jgi:hypothetical protein
MPAESSDGLSSIRARANICVPRTIASRRPLPVSVKKPTHKWHIWFCPTHKPTLRKTKRAIFCQRTDKQTDNNSNSFYIAQIPQLKSFDMSKIFCNDFLSFF